MTNLLNGVAIETSSRLGGVALGVNGQVIAQEEFAADRDCAAELLPVVDRLCKQVGWRPEGIRQIYVSVGPGSFTGTRIGVTFAKTLAMGVAAQVVAVPTFEALALNALAAARPPEDLVVLMDARRGQVFSQRFRLRADGTGYESVRAGSLVDVHLLMRDARQGTVFVGPGTAVHREELAKAGPVLGDELATPRVEAVYRVGWRMAEQGLFSDVDALVPVYYRLPTPVERLQGPGR